MKKLFRYTGIGLLSILFIMVILLINIIWFKPFFIKIFYEKASVELIIDQHELMSMLGLPIRYFNNKFTDVSIKQEEKRRKKYEKTLHTLKKYNYDRLNEEEKLSYDILTWQLADRISSVPWQYHNYPVNQLNGIQSELPKFMDSFHRVKNDKDARDYITRLSKFPVKFSQIFEGLQKREEMGIIPPKFVIEKVLIEMNKFIDADVEKNILWFSFRNKLMQSQIDSKKHEGFLAEVKNEIEKSVYPSYQLLISYLENIYQKATTDDGVWKFPEGDTFYQYILEKNTHTNFSAEEIHQIGLKEVDRIQSEMTEIFTTLGISSKISFRQKISELMSDEKFRYPDTKESYEQILKDYQDVIDHIENNLDVAFHKKPKARVEVKRVPEFMEANSPFAYYNIPAMDGSRPGVFYINQRHLSDHIKYNMATLAYHEAIPGHHFQIALQLELKGLPLFRKLNDYNVFIEGWALYAEYLAWELGFHEDAYTNLGRLDAELHRAVRLVVDTGIHYKRWTREQAIAYMYENTGLVMTDIESEVERYIVNPAQACSYKMGMIRILDMRQKAMAALGDKFNLADFHDVILDNGAIPMPILEKEVDRYIGSKLIDENRLQGRKVKGRDGAKIQQGESAISHWTSVISHH
jgi:uncharacterized protein (DUF885 family)